MIAYKNHLPKIEENVFIAHNATLIGNINIQKEASIWYNAVLRGDLNFISIGEQTNIQEGVCIHVTTEKPTIIKKRVTVGHGAILHSCQIENDALIGMGAIILDGATIETGAMVGAGCVVPPNKIVPAHHLALGNPMKVIRPLTELEIKHNFDNALMYVKLAKDYQSPK